MLSLWPSRRALYQTDSLCSAREHVALKKESKSHVDPGHDRVTMAKENGYFLILLALVVHLVYMVSIFDMYFRSPLVHGMTPHAPKLAAPARRLVLFSADGLRYDRFFERDPTTGEPRAPYLHRIVRERGSWGVSHTRVPTETRPGHIALISGFYEDVSAVTKGWKENPVEFDSLFNQSRHAWCWGAPDVLTIFVPRGGLDDHVAMWMLPPDLIDMGHADASVLDAWVFERVKGFFNGSRADRKLKEMLDRDKIVFFLHLIGTDTNGHAYKPLSREYLTNIPKVDKGVKEIEQLIENYYKDNRTAYIFSSDHGMTDWGAHGAGDPEETLIPLVAWGAGIRGPQPMAAAAAAAPRDINPELPDEWGLNDLTRLDISQADTTPLMSSLVGIPVPVNSVGVLPIRYLNASPSYVADAALANVLQILDAFDVKEKRAKAKTLSLLYRPYAALMKSERIKRLGHIEDAIKGKQYKYAVELTETFINQLLIGMRYYETYDRLFVGVAVVIGYAGWMLCIVVELLGGLPRRRARSHRLLDRAAAAVALGLTVLLYVISSPITYYFYCLLPVLFWNHVVKCRSVFQSNFEQLRRREFGLTVIASIAVTEALVFSFFERKTLSLGCCVLAAWPLASANVRQKLNRRVQIGWIASCLSVALCAALPLPNAADHNVYLIVLGSGVAIGLSIYAVSRLSAGKRTLSLFAFQLAWLVVATIVAVHTSTSLTNKRGLPTLNQTLSWIILFTSLVVPSFATRRLLVRLLTIALAFLPCYVLLTMQYEVIFYAAFSSLMFFWLCVEYCQSNETRLELLEFGRRLNIADAEERSLRLSDVRTAVLFVFFTFSAFFGTGNFASVNTFDPSSVRCFITIINPAIMSCLLLWKVAVPFFLVSCAFSAVHVVARFPLRQLFLVVLLLSDLMALQFFFMVTDHGSWLEIGLSISHYVIMMLVTVATLILFALAQILTGSVRPTFRFVAKKTI